jgi:hypothetical protein
MPSPPLVSSKLSDDFSVLISPIVKRFGAPKAR